MYGSGAPMSALGTAVLGVQAIRAAAAGNPAGSIVAGKTQSVANGVTQLAFTGASGVITIIGVLLVLVGIVLTIATRRRV